jgi:hemophore-related protein
VIGSEVRVAIPTLDEGSKRMLLSGRAMRGALVGAVGAGAMAGAMLFGGASLAFAQPTPAPPPPPPAPGCTAGDLAQASGVVGTAMADYLFSHPEVNDFFTSLRGLPNEEIRGDVQIYMDAHPQVEAEINGIRQPVTDLRNRCDAPAPVGG